jgi:GntR family transcriptional repressor for pyruvate dehydrogenase complex
MKPQSLESVAPVAPIRRAKLRDQIYDQIFALVVDGEFAQGTKLPTEIELAERFAVSRTVVREALARLRDDGIVVSRQGAGTFVERRPDSAILRFAPLGSIADVQRCYEFRVALEGEAAACAALRRDPEALRRMETAVDALDDVIRVGAVGTDADFRFHLTIAEATQNPFFVSVMASLNGHVALAISIARSLSLMRPASRIKAVQAEHRAIVEAIRAGDSDRARNAMRRHLDSARKRVFEGTGPEGAAPGS